MSPKWANILENGWRNEHFCSTALEYPQEEDIKDTSTSDERLSDNSLTDITNKILEGI